MDGALLKGKERSRVRVTVQHSNGVLFCKCAGLHPALGCMAGLYHLQLFWAVLYGELQSNFRGFLSPSP